MATATSRERRLWTEEELQALPDDGFKHEVVGGELVMSPKNNFQHENICAGLLVVLRTFFQDSAILSPRCSRNGTGISWQLGRSSEECAAEQIGHFG